MVGAFWLTFWGEREDMGYSYYQRGFDTAKDMLDWSSKNNVDWGWKGAGGHAQLFYPTRTSEYYPSFRNDIEAYPASDCNLDLNDPYPTKRSGFVTKDHLVNHPSWADTPARVSYLAQI